MSQVHTKAVIHLRARLAAADRYGRDLAGLMPVAWPAPRRP